MKTTIIRKDKLLVDYMLSRSYGDVISHKEISEIIGERYGTQKYQFLVNAAKKALVDAGHMIANVRKTGYQIVNPDAYTDYAVSDVKAGARRIDRGAKVLKHAPVSNMSVEGLTAYNRVNDRMQILASAIAGTKVELRILNNKPHPLLLQTNK